MATKKVESGADLRVIELPRLYEAADVLTRSFLANPNFVDLFPDEKARARPLPHVQRACLRDALGMGRVYAASRGDALVGVAAWLPPPHVRSAPAVYGRRDEAASRAAVLVPGGGRRRARRAGDGDRDTASRARSHGSRRSGAALLP
jgi:hypothetical protein